MTPRKNPEDKLKVGRKSDYKPEYADEVEKICRLFGADNEELANYFGVVVSTICLWRTKHPKFSEAIRLGKEISDANVSDRLYMRAMGYQHDDTHVSSYEGEITLTPIKKNYPPDTAACIFWLKNRQPKIWRDKHDLEHTGKDGSPLTPVLNVTIGRS